MSARVWHARIPIRRSALWHTASAGASAGMAARSSTFTMCVEGRSGVGSHQVPSPMSSWIASLGNEPLGDGMSISGSRGSVAPRRISSMTLRTRSPRSLSPSAFVHSGLSRSGCTSWPSTRLRNESAPAYSRPGVPQTMSAWWGTVRSTPRRLSWARARWSCTVRAPFWGRMPRSQRSVSAPVSEVPRGHAPVIFHASDAIRMWAGESTSPRPVSISTSGEAWSSAIRVVAMAGLLRSLRVRPRLGLSHSRS